MMSRFLGYVRFAVVLALAAIAAVQAAQANTELDRALMKAIRSGDLATVKQLVAKGADVNQFGDRSPLYLAAFRNQLEIAKFLVAAGAKVNGVIWEPDVPYVTPLQIAAAVAGGTKDYRMVDFLLSVGADPAAGGTRMESPLTTAVMTGHLDQVKRIVELGNSDIEYKRRPPRRMGGGEGQTALMTAARQGFVEIVAYLLEQGAQLDNWIYCGQTALYYAAQSGEVEVVKYLIKAGAEVNPPRRTGCRFHVTPIRDAHDPEVIRLLLEAGAEDNRPYK